MNVVPFITDKLSNHEKDLGRCLFPSYYTNFSKDYPFEVVVSLELVRPTIHDIALDKICVPFETGYAVWGFKSIDDRNAFLSQIDEIGAKI